MNWKEIKEKLEGEYLAPCLRGHIRYFVTSMRRTFDSTSRPAIRMDGCDLVCEAYCARYAPDLQAQPVVKLGLYDQRAFYRAFIEYEQNSPSANLQSVNLLVRTLALLDGRVDAQTLDLLALTIADEPRTFRYFFAIRCDAEHAIAEL